jgi:hypothetical protein
VAVPVPTLSAALWGILMKEKERRRVAVQLLDELRGEVLAAVERMPDGWDQVELSWYVAHRAELLAASPGDRLRRLSYEHAIRSRGL